MCVSSSFFFFLVLSTTTSKVCSIMNPPSVCVCVYLAAAQSSLFFCGSPTVKRDEEKHTHQIKKFVETDTGHVPNVCVVISSNWSIFPRLFSLL